MDSIWLGFVNLCLFKFVHVSTLRSCTILSKEILNMMDGKQAS